MVFGQGPLFCVSKKLIRRHPVSVYELFANKFTTKSIIKYAMKNNPHLSELLLKHHDKEIEDSYINHNNSNNVFKEVFDTINIQYHNELQRFWTIFFTHGLRNNETLFRIHKYNIEE